MSVTVKTSSLQRKAEGTSLGTATSSNGARTNDDGYSAIELRARLRRAGSLGTLNLHQVQVDYYLTNPLSLSLYVSTFSSMISFPPSVNVPTLSDNSYLLPTAYITLPLCAAQPLRGRSRGQPSREPTHKLSFRGFVSSFGTSPTH